MTDNQLTTYYELVYADPPWKQRKGGLRKSRPGQKRKLDYKTLSIEQIKNILGNYDSKILFVWAIDKFLFDAEKIVKELGFRLHARIIWDKMNGVAPAFTVRFSHEYLLWFYKSPMCPIAEEYRGKFTTVIREKPTVHSKKPVSAYYLIECLYPNLSKIELFARNKREGWDSWGNETNKFPKQTILN
ncbi:MAG: MT-A70 family methyltransferase [Proteiniphilum sp.]|jgi:N6-adenosine-specific RNA methylase IME4|uniref:MT-A70 family methyltransferase n=1 Tax=Proteiniphilum sp. TaxID=1926877 RepID=UPI002B1FF039|nr:MT-A70 family methyltransferase [Proteiniphilum sp.]MEA5128312.1 MT-A70 family methyltransferase [Proteiniphilum sp.]